MLDFLKNIFKKSAYGKAEYPTKYAFTSGGIDYYQLEDFNNTPALRGLKTMVFYEEMKMKCTMEFLKLHVEAVDNILLDRKINIFEIKKLNDQLKQRLDMALDMDLVMKLASVVFFPKNENITDYDFDFNARKMQHWKQHDGADFFFVDAAARINASFKGFEREFKELYNGSRQAKQNAFGQFVTTLAGKQDAEIERQVLFLCGGDATKIEAIRGLTLWRYLFVLNEKLKPPPPPRKTPVRR